MKLEDVTKGCHQHRAHASNVGALLRQHQQQDLPMAQQSQAVQQPNNRRPRLKSLSPESLPQPTLPITCCFTKRSRLASGPSPATWLSAR